jgi:archaemetzincin
MSDQNITLISFGYFEKELLEKVADAVRLEFHLPVIQKEGHIDISDFFDPGRKQYEGNKLLLAVDSLAQPGSGKTLGLFNVDLYIPILTFIFGQAFLSGRTGIASLYRLKNERYGMVANDASLADRFKKEVIHELGHTFGLIHCHVPTCVMRSSTYVEDIDQKEQHLCSNCHDLLMGEVSSPGSAAGK